MRNISTVRDRETKNTLFNFNNIYAGYSAVYENMETYGTARQATDYNTIRAKQYNKQKKREENLVE